MRIKSARNQSRPNGLAAFLERITGIELMRKNCINIRTASGQRYTSPKQIILRTGWIYPAVRKCSALI